MSAAFVLATALLLIGDPPGDLESEKPIVITGVLSADISRGNASDDNISEFDERDLDAFNADDVDDVLALVPNMTGSGGSQGVTSRGADTTGLLNNLAASLGGARSRATIDVDGRSLGYFEYIFGELPLWDAEQVSVVRGPLLMTLARPSPNGGIFLRHQTPQPEIDAAMQLKVASLNRRDVAGMANLPVAFDGALALRVTAERSESRAASDIADNMVGADPNRIERNQFRAYAGFDPPGEGLRVVVGAGRLETLSPQIVGLRPPYKDRRDPSATYGVFGIVAETLTLDSGGRFDGGDWSAQASLGRADVTRFAPRGLGELHSDVEDRSVTAAVRLKLGREMGLLVGGRLEDVRQSLVIDISTVRAGVGTFDDYQQDRGAFASLHVPLSDDFDIHAGVRLQRYHQRRDGELVSPALPVRALDFEGDWTALLPSLSIIHALSDTAELQFTLERGFHPGGVTINPITGELDAFDPERLGHAEFSIRLRPVPGLRMRANLFIDRLTDAQRALVESRAVGGAPPIEVVRYNNAPRAHASGAELDLDWDVDPRISLWVGAAILATQILETDSLSDPALGKSFARSPPWSGSARLAWRPTAAWSLSLTARGHGPYFSDDRETAARRIGGAVMFDARAARALGNIELAAWARNLADRFSLTYLAEDGLASAANPREIGLSLTARR